MSRLNYNLKDYLFREGYDGHMDIPCLIVAYARSANVERLIRELHLQGVNEFYVAIDGARTPDVHKIQDHLIQRLDSLSEDLSVSIKVWRRSKNLGIAVSVITAIDWFFSFKDFGLIIEDDLEVSSDFLRFIEDGRKSKNLNTVMLSGNRFFSEPEKAILSSYPATWGWATWKSEWICMRETVINFPRVKFRYFFASDYQFWLLGSLRVFRGGVDTWDIPIALYMKNKSKHSLLPPNNLVSNVGADNFASHTVVDNFPIGIPLETFDRYELDESKATTKNYDQQLRALVYQIKFRHFFLAPYLLTEYFYILFAKNRLNRRVQQASFKD
jgi:hypothetical protein